MRFRLVNPTLFVRKTVSVFVLAFALVPLVALKQDVPATAYAGGLVVLHLFILGIYLYRVRFRELDPDWRSLGARVLAIAAVVYLLSAASSLDPQAPVATLARQVLAISVLHTVVLLLLMVRVEPRPRTPDATLEPAASAGPGATLADRPSLPEAKLRPEVTSEAGTGPRR